MILRWDECIEMVCWLNEFIEIVSRLDVFIEMNQRLDAAEGMVWCQSKEARGWGFGGKDRQTDRQTMKMKKRR